MCDEDTYFFIGRDSCKYSEKYLNLTKTIIRIQIKRSVVFGKIDLRKYHGKRRCSFGIIFRFGNIGRFEYNRSCRRKCARFAVSFNLVLDTIRYMIWSLKIQIFVIIGNGHCAVFRHGIF